MSNPCHFSAFFEIYTIHNLLASSDFNFSAKNAFQIPKFKKFKKQKIKTFAEFAKTVKKSSIKMEKRFLTVTITNHKTPRRMIQREKEAPPSLDATFSVT